MQEKIPLRVIASAIVVLAVIVLITTTSIQRAYAPTCATCAKQFTPSHQSSIIGSGVPGGAKQFAPGHLVPPGPNAQGASDFAPGIVKSQEYIYGK